MNFCCLHILDVTIIISKNLVVHFEHMPHIFYVACVSNIVVPKQMQDVSFENKAALFTLAVSELMMVNVYVFPFYMVNTFYCESITNHSSYRLP